MTTTPTFRPHIHYSPRQGWMNDPNGLIYFDGEYHMFYQYYPYADVWGPMHWGHAVSKDLMTWEELDYVLEPYEDTMIFSGSAVIDTHNTAGFGYGENGEPAMVAIYTSHYEKDGVIVESQSIAYSLDRGRTFTNYEHIPVLPNPQVRDFRDPKVFWYDEGSYWVMTLVQTDRVCFYKSTNLKQWQFLSDFGQQDGAHGGVWECPDLIRFGDEWVLLVSVIAGAPNGGSAMQYFVGTFDGIRFRNANAPDDVRWLDYGADNYAGVTWANVPDGRTLYIAWMNNWDYARLTPSVDFRGVMTIARELTLINGHLKQVPVRELQRYQTLLAREERTFTLLEAPWMLELEGTSANDWDIVITHDEQSFTRIAFNYGQNTIEFDRTTSGDGQFHASFPTVHHAPCDFSGGHVRLRLLIDLSSIELFWNDGEVVMTEQIFPRSYQSLTINGQIALTRSELYTLRAPFTK